MPDFNKGDFTQQGVNGHVNATVRLNEKRLVNIDLTSNEEAAGCTITGTVKDLLNNQVYGVGAGVSGNIEITENGENINVAPYATATVNVAGGGGGLPKCTITIVNDPTSEEDVPLSLCVTDYVMLNNNYVELPIQHYNNPIIITVGNSYTFDGLYQHSSFDNENWYIAVHSDMTATASNAVNCTFTDDRVFITDITADSSITLTFVVTR